MFLLDDELFHKTSKWPNQEQTLMDKNIQNTLANICGYPADQYHLDDNSSQRQPNFGHFALHRVKLRL